MPKMPTALTHEGEYMLRLSLLRENVHAMVAASRAAGRSRDWVAGYIAGSGMAFSEPIQEANRAFFEEAWPADSTE